MIQYLEVKNWDKFQHYKDRSPPWIKVHRELLDDYEFTRLQDASKLHLILIWVLASQLDNRIPNDPAWIAKKIGATEIINLNILIAKNFLSVVQDASKPQTSASNVLAKCSPETEAEAEAEAYRPPEAEKEDCRNEIPYNEVARSTPGYSFCGHVIKLKTTDYDLWNAQYAGTSDQFYDYLDSRDDWLSRQPPEAQKNWFMSTARHIQKLKEPSHATS